MNPHLGKWKYNAGEYKARPGCVEEHQDASSQDTGKDLRTFPTCTQQLFDVVVFFFFSLTVFPLLIFSSVHRALYARRRSPEMSKTVFSMPLGSHLSTLPRGAQLSGAEVENKVTGQGRRVFCGVFFL